VTPPRSAPVAWSPSTMRMVRAMGPDSDGSKASLEALTAVVLLDRVRLHVSDPTSSSMRHRDMTPSERLGANREEYSQDERAFHGSFPCGE